METIQSLIDLLTSQSALMQELLSVVRDEKRCVTTWDHALTLELAKKKDTLVLKERVLDEARRKIVASLASRFGLEEPSISDLIPHITDESAKEQILSIVTTLSATAKEIHRENLSLKILYRSNLGALSDVFQQLGVQNAATYTAAGKTARTGSGFQHCG